MITVIHSITNWINKKIKEKVKREVLEIGAGEQIIIDKPENILRIGAGLINDAHEYPKNDENFKRK